MFSVYLQSLFLNRSEVFYFQQPRKAVNVMQQLTHFLLKQNICFAIRERILYP